MRRERGKALFDALLISDIRKYPVENTDFRSAVSRYRKTCHRHEDKKSARLERYGLTARIRACNDQGIVAVADTYVDRYDAVLGDQGVSCALQSYSAVRVKICAE